MMCKPAKCVHAWVAARQGDSLGCISIHVNYICLMLRSLSLARLGLDPRTLTLSPMSLPRILLRSSGNRNCSAATDTSPLKQSKNDGMHL